MLWAVLVGGDKLTEDFCEAYRDRESSQVLHSADILTIIFNDINLGPGHTQTCSITDIR
jgi:hypothetical protein